MIKTSFDSTFSCQLQNDVGDGVQKLLKVMDIVLRESLNVFPAVFRKPAGGGIKAALNWFFDSNFDFFFS